MTGKGSGTRIAIIGFPAKSVRADPSRSRKVLSSSVARSKMSERKLKSSLPIAIVTVVPLALVTVLEVVSLKKEDAGGLCVLLMRVNDVAENSSAFTISSKINSIVLPAMSTLNSLNAGGLASRMSLFTLTASVRAVMLFPDTSAKAPSSKNKYVLCLDLPTTGWDLRVFRSSMKRVTSIFKPLPFSTALSVRVISMTVFDELVKETKPAIKLDALMTSLNVRLRKPESKSRSKERRIGGIISAVYTLTC